LLYFYVDEPHEFGWTLEEVACPELVVVSRVVLQLSTDGLVLMAWRSNGQRVEIRTFTIDYTILFNSSSFGCNCFHLIILHLLSAVLCCSAMYCCAHFTVFLCCTQVSRMAFVELKIDPKYHRHIIGRSGANGLCRLFLILDIFT